MATPCADMRRSKKALEKKCAYLRRYGSTWVSMACGIPWRVVSTKVPQLTKRSCGTLTAVLRAACVGCTARAELSQIHPTLKGCGATTLNSRYYLGSGCTPRPSKSR